MTQAILITVAILAVANAAFTLADPTWKRAEAALILRLAAWIARELYAHADAQEASREAYQRVYQDTRNAGNWTPAVRAASLNECAAAQLPEPAAALHPVA